MNIWTTDNHETVIEMPADQPLLQGSSHAQLGSLATFDAPILQIMNRVPAWRVDRRETATPGNEALEVSGAQAIITD